MKKTIYNIIVATLIVALMFIVSISAISAGYTPASIATTPAPNTNQAEILNTWKQAVQSEYHNHKIIYKGGATK